MIWSCMSVNGPGPCYIFDNNMNSKLYLEVGVTGPVGSRTPWGEEREVSGQVSPNERVSTGCRRAKRPKTRVSRV